MSNILALPALIARDLARLSFVAVGALALTSCIPGRFADISYARGRAPSYLVYLAWDASRNNPKALLELGELYERGERGLPKSELCAARLYEAAAIGEHGLEEARARLERIRQRQAEPLKTKAPTCDDVAERNRWRSFTPEERDAWIEGKLK